MKKREISTDTAEIKKKRILWTIIYQQIWQPRRNRQLSRDLQPAKTKSGRNRSIEQSDH